MSEAVEGSGLHRVKYINLKNENDEQTPEIFNPLAKQGYHSRSSFSERISLVLILKIISVLAASVIFIVVSCSLYSKVIHYNPNEKYDPENSSIDALTGSTASLENIDRVNITKIQEAADVIRNENLKYQSVNHSLNGCMPVKNVKKVIFVASTNLTLDNSCTDNATCHSLLQTIEQEFKGLKYNFVISGEGELYVGLGFKCLPNNSESALYIKLFGRASLYNNKPCLRITEIVEQGILCGYISKNFNVKYKRWDNDYEQPYRIRKCQSYHRSLHFHNPVYEMSSLIHGDFKWTVCGNFSHTTEVRKSRVITLESLSKQSCLPLEEVNEVQVDFIEADHFNCSRISYCIKMFEEQHEGLHFNFIIGLQTEIYTGLGFRCRANNTAGNVLKIKVLEPPGSLAFPFDKHRKFVQILKEGIACGKVLEDLTVKANCQKFEESGEYRVAWCEHTYKKIGWELRHSVIRSLKEDDFNITSKHIREIGPGKSTLRNCNRSKEHNFLCALKKKKEHTTFKPIRTTDDESSSHLDSLELDESDDNYPYVDYSYI